MALRLGEYVVYGELYNRRNYTTFGLIVLRGPVPGRETVVRIDLTGNCDPDLCGKGFRFKPRNDGEGPVFFEKDFPGFQIRQIGATGTMTAQGWAKALPCGAEEYLRRRELGEPPPTPWLRRLYLEWYSQNGRVVIEMADPIVEEECIGESRDRVELAEWKQIPNLALPPDAILGKPSLGPDISVIHMEGDNARVEHWTPIGETEGNDYEAGSSLQRQLDAESAAVDRAIRGEDDPDDVDDAFADVELMDFCLDHAETVPLRSFLTRENLPRPEDLDDNAAEAQLKFLLAELALASVAFDVCEHFTPRDCYRLLLDTLLDDDGHYEALVGTGWVTHLSTWEHCPTCLLEYEQAPDQASDTDSDPEEPPF